MPIYEYECKKCGRITEALQGFSDPPLKKCEHCKGKLEKLISLSSFHLQGTGWYSTDYVKGPGIPPKAEAQDNPALKNENGTQPDTTSSSSDSAETSASKVESIKKETKKARNSSKSSSA